MGRLKAFDTVKKPKKQVPKQEPISDELNEQIMAKIKQRRLQILIHSCIYYKYDSNIIDDHTYNRWAQELAKLQADYPKESKAVKDYYKDFKEWQGEQCGSGFNLPLNSPWVLYKANQLLEANKNECKNK